MADEPLPTPQPDPPNADVPPVIVEVPTTPVVTATTPEQIQAAVSVAVEARTQELQEQIATRQAVEEFTGRLSSLETAVSDLSATISERIGAMEALLETLIETLTPEGEQEPENPNNDKTLTVDAPKASGLRRLNLL